jgi:hypothetical protein
MVITNENDGRTATQASTNNLPLRSFLLSEVLSFVKLARSCPGVSRIAMIGSLTTSKPQPKDADVLISVADGADLTVLAKAGRRLKGRAQSQNSGADIFLANPEGEYIGRTCHWRECRPFLRLACDAQHCGQREFLHDDLDAVTLAAKLVQEPPVDLWPKVVRRIKVPEDVELQLLRPLEA